MKQARQKLLAVLLITSGAIGLAGAIYLYVSQPRPPRTDGSVVATEPAPSSVAPSKKTIANYSVPPTDPKYIAIPTIHVAQTRIMRLGNLANGQIAAPDNIYDTGWYEASAKPGKPGAMFVFGHVSSWTADGIFYNLKKLKSGDKITIVRGDAKQFVYQVAAVKVYPYDKVDMSTVLSPIDASKSGLNLMTCTGKIIKGTNEFSERLVVFASLVSG